jgi:hypothetical protein
VVATQVYAHFLSKKNTLFASTLRSFVCAYACFILFFNVFFLADFSESSSEDEFSQKTASSQKLCDKISYPIIEYVKTS